MKQVIKNCKLNQKGLKLEDETNFTKEKKKEMNEKHRQDVMDCMEPVRVIAEKLERKIKKQIAGLLFK